MVTRFRRQIAILTAIAALCAVVFLAPLTGQGPQSLQVPQGQAPGDQRAIAPARAGDTSDETAAAARARRLAQQFDAEARVLTVFDRQGNVVTTVGERAVYWHPAFSPDRTRLAVVKIDLASNTENLLVLEIATGNSTQITSHGTPAETERRDQVHWPAWSPDGRQVAYAVLRGGSFGLYRKASNGEGPEELLYQHPGAVRGNGVTLDWSMDGGFLNFSTTDLSGGILYRLPLASDGARTPVEVFRSEARVVGFRTSPDGRVFSYASNESGTTQVYVRPSDPLAAARAAPAGGRWQLSEQGSQDSAASWRRDGKELYYLAAGRGVMAVDVSTAPELAFGNPRLLFRLSEAVPIEPGLSSVSRDGERVVIAVPHAPTLQQITMFDRQGNVMQRVAEPGRYRDASLSPDGKRVAVVRAVPETGNVDIWTFDVASGQGTPVTSDASPDNAPIWSPDGRQVAYVSRRGSFTGIYRKAWDGRGSEEQLFRYTPGADMVLTDWSGDGEFLTFHDGCQGVLHVIPLSPNRKAVDGGAIEWLRDEYNVMQARLSPDSRFMAYLSDEREAGIFEVYVRPFDVRTPDVSREGTSPVQVSQSQRSGTGMIFWRRDGRELYYLQTDLETGDRLMMAVDVSTTPTFFAGTPRLLFKFPASLRFVGNLNQWKNVSGDGQRFVFAVSVPASMTAR